MIVISACLCGVNCKYNGKSNMDKELLEMVTQGKCILICPEQLGGLPTPRQPHEIIEGSGEEVLKGKAKVMSKEGLDSTSQFIKGAYEALNISKMAGAKIAILKSNSPSCGCGYIYDGKFDGTKVKGNGVTAELFIKNGIKVFNEKDFKLLKSKGDINK